MIDSQHGEQVYYPEKSDFPSKKGRRGLEPRRAYTRTLQSRRLGRTELRRQMRIPKTHRIQQVVVYTQERSETQLHTVSV